MTNIDGLQPAKDAAKISPNSYPVGPTADGQIVYAPLNPAMPLNIIVISVTGVVIFTVLGFYSRSACRFVLNRLSRLRTRLKPETESLPTVANTTARMTKGPHPQVQPRSITLSALPVSRARTSTLEMSIAPTNLPPYLMLSVPNGGPSHADYLTTTRVPALMHSPLGINTAATSFTLGPSGDLLSRRGNSTLAPILPPVLSTSALVMPDLVSPASATSTRSSVGPPTPTDESNEFVYGVRIEMEREGKEKGDVREVEDLDEGDDGARRRE